MHIFSIFCYIFNREVDKLGSAFFENKPLLLSPIKTVSSKFTFRYKYFSPNNFFSSEFKKSKRILLASETCLKNKKNVLTGRIM